MGKMVEIDEEELNAVREQAASSVPWQMEAQRLADALRRVAPEHELLDSDVWNAHFEQHRNHVNLPGDVSPSYPKAET